MIVALVSYASQGWAQCPSYELEVDVIPASIHGQGSDVHCYAFSMAPGTNITAMMGFTLGFEVLDGSFHSFTTSPGLIGATSSWGVPIDIVTTGNSINLFGYASLSGTPVNLNLYNNPIATICIQEDPFSAEDPCLNIQISGIAVNGVAGGEFCEVEVQGGNLICASNFTPNCAAITAGLDYQGKNGDHHCFWFYFHDPSLLVNVIGMNLQFEMSPLGSGTGVFSSPTYLPSVTRATANWMSPASSGTSSGGSGPGTVASFNATKGNPTGPFIGDGDFSGVAPYFIKLLIYEPLGDEDYCVTGMGGQITFELADGSAHVCDLDDLIKDLEACTDRLVSEGNIRTQWACLDAPPGMFDVEVHVNNIQFPGVECITHTDVEGDYSCVISANSTDLIRIEPMDDGDFLCGVTANDLSILLRHIVGLAPITNNRIVMAMDPSADFLIDIRDVSALRQALLGLPTSPTYANPWRMVPEDDYVNIVGGPTLHRSIPYYDEYVEFFFGDPYNPNFYGIKVGDLDDDCLSCHQNKLASEDPIEEIAVWQSTDQGIDRTTWSIGMPSGALAHMAEVRLAYEGELPSDVDIEVHGSDINGEEAYMVNQETEDIHVLYVSDRIEELRRWDGETPILSISTADRAWLSSLRIASGLSYDLLSDERSSWVLEADRSADWQLSSDGRSIWVSNVSEAQEVVMELYNLQGQLTDRSSLNLARGTSHYRLPQDILTGIYLVRVSGTQDIHERILIR